jgi:ribulose-phosphate 3-epimerase
MPAAIAPSILSADFARLGEEVAEVEQAGADRIHVDVMDGHFVPNLSMGPAVVNSLRSVTRLPLEVHLMVQDPARFTEPFIKAGAATLIAHLEVLAEPRSWIEQVRGLGRQAGLAVKPDAAVERLEPYLAELDLALCMTVYPGFSGQSYLADSPVRIRKLRELINRVNPRCELEVDGGIDLQTARPSVAAGASVLVAATAVFRASDGPGAAVRALRSSLEN